jgi:hypothetical protein
MNNDITTSVDGWERETRVTDNYSKVPHGLWTLDMTYGAKCLLGWLHSHTTAYLSTLSMRRIRGEFGCSGVVAQWIEELEAGGFVTIVGDGKRRRYRLMAGPWDALATRPKRSQDVEMVENRPLETVENRPLSEQRMDENRPQNGRKSSTKRSKIVHIEEQGEEQLEEQKKHSRAQSSNSPTNTVARVSVQEPDDFDAWWSQYPRKTAKANAERAWRKLRPADRTGALDALPDHVRAWRLRGTATEYVPHPATWLNGRRWEDDLTSTSGRKVNPVMAALEDRFAAARLRETVGAPMPELAYDHEHDDWGDE